jgi:hypothetical protein
MSMNVRYSTRFQSFLTGFAFRFGAPLPVDGAFPAVVNRHDLFMRLGGQNRLFFLEASIRGASSVTGFIGQSDERDTIVLSHQPIEPKFDFDYDALAYGNLARNLNVFFGVLSGSNFAAPSPRNERFCRHVTYSGELTTKHAELPLSDVSFDICDKTIITRYSSQNVYGGGLVANLDPLSVTPVPWHTTNDGMYDLGPILNFLVGNTIDFTEIFGAAPVRQIMSDFEYDVTPYGISVNYRMHVHNLLDGDSYNWRSSTLFFPKYSAPTFPPNIGDVRFSQYLGQVVSSYGYGTFENAHAPQGSLSGTSGEPSSPPKDEYSFFPIFLSGPPILDIAVQGDVAANAAARLSNNEYLGKFAEAVALEWNDIIPSSLFSTVDAFNKMEGSLNMNVLQNLAKIPSIASAIPQLKEAVAVLSTIARRDFRLSSIKEILDFATSTNLQANFQWRPYLSLFTEYMPKVASTLNSLRNKGKNSVTYGSYRHKLFNEFGRKEVTLLTRTKMVMDASPSGLLSAVLGLDALGVLPTASNLWDIIPFSFAANWFTGIGANLRRAEKSLILATVPAYYVHTYLLTSPLDEDELESLKMSSTTANPGTLRLFYRDVSFYSPMPRDSKFGFGIPTSLPSAGLMGSLLYQLIFG